MGAGHETELELRVKLLHDKAHVPEHAVGLPSVVQIAACDDVDVEPFGRTMVHTGVSVALPDGCAGMAIPCRELAWRCGMTFVNTPGLVDTGYRGELCFLVQNLDASQTLHIADGQVVGRLAVVATQHCVLKRVPEHQDEAEGVEMQPLREHENGSVVEVTMLDEQLQAPEYAHELDNGLDLRSASTLDLAPFERAVISFGMALHYDDELMLQIQPRSGLSLRTGLSIVDSPSIVDRSEAAQELTAVFINTDAHETIHIERGDRIAQLVAIRAPRIVVNVVEELDQTQRGADGFGSSGV